MPIQTTTPLSSRDVVNAVSLKSIFTSRSRNRGDGQAVTRWMGKQFQRWIVSTFEHVVTLESINDFHRFTGSEAPEWLVLKIDSNPEQPLVLIDPTHPYLLALEKRCAEWLNSRLGTLDEDKFPRFIPSVVLNHWQKDHNRMKKRTLSGIIHTSGKACQIAFKGKGFQVVELDPSEEEFRKELNNESVNMGHCVGLFANKDELTGGYGESYALAAERDTLRLFSLRDGVGRAHVTISLQKTDTNEWEIEQVKGKQNRPPVFKYAETVRQFLNYIAVVTKPHYDCSAAGIFADNGRFVSAKDVTDLDLKYQIVAYSPYEAEEIDIYESGLKWFSILRYPERVVDIKNAGAVMTAVAILLSKKGADILTQSSPVHRLLTKGLSRGEIDGEKFHLPKLSEWID